MHLLDLDTHHMLSKDKDVRNNNFRHTDCSPNGLYVAVVAKCSRIVELHVLIIETHMFLRQGMVELQHVCPGFYATRAHTDYFECKFSPDSRYIAVASSHGYLVVMSRSALKSYCNITPGVFDINDVKVANERSFDFDPRFFHRYLAFGSMNNEVFICDIEEERIFTQTKFEDLVGEIDTLKYGPKKQGLAVATSTSVIYICDPDSLDILYTLNGAEQASASMTQINGHYPSIIRLSFSTAGDNLAVTSTDGLCRIWQLQPVINLQDLCRLAIMQHCTMKNMEHLPIPPKLLFFLLNWPEWNTKPCMWSGYKYTRNWAYIFVHTGVFVVYSLLIWDEKPQQLS